MSPLCPASFVRRGRRELSLRNFPARTPTLGSPTPFRLTHTAPSSITLHRFRSSLGPWTSSEHGSGGGVLGCWGPQRTGRRAHWRPYWCRGPPNSLTATVQGRNPTLSRHTNRPSTGVGARRVVGTRVRGTSRPDRGPVWGGSIPHGPGPCTGVPTPPCESLQRTPV